MIDDASKEVWRRQFTPILHAHLPLIATLKETADKVNSAKGFIETLSSEVDAERGYGLFITRLAIQYAMKTLEFFGLIDGDDAPLPVNLPQANQVLTNLIAHINEDLQHAQFAAGGRGDNEDAAPIEDEDIDVASRCHWVRVPPSALYCETTYENSS